MTITLQTRFTLTFALTLVTTTSLFLLSTPAHHRYLLSFFLLDLPPLTGSVRILSYGGTLVIAYLSYISRPPFGDSPLHAPQLYDFTLPSFFSLEGTMQLLGKQWINHRRLSSIRNMVLIAWLCCIVGVGGSLPPIIVGLGTFVLHGVVSGLIGTSHRWYVPVYALLALMFANGNSTLSLDHYLSLSFPHYPFRPSLSLIDSPVTNSGYARKLILIASICTLVFGGITKLLNGGVHWLNGKSLAYYVSSEENGRSTLLKTLMHRSPQLSFFLSVSSIVLECGAGLAVFSQWWRPIILLNAALFHFGIWLTMWPNYAPQTWCYGIGQQWSWESDYNPSEINQLFEQLGFHRYHQQDSHTMLQHITNFDLPPYLFSTAFIAAWVGLSLCVLLSIITLFRIEYWPFTGIPMYSFYRDHSFSYKFLRDEQQAQRVAVEHVDSGYPNTLAWSNLWVILRLKNTDPAMQSQIDKIRQQRRLARVEHHDYNVSKDDVNEEWYVNIKTRVTSDSVSHGVLTKQWRRTLHNIAALDMAVKPRGKIRAMTEGKPAKIEIESEISGDDSDYEEVKENEQVVRQRKIRSSPSSDTLSQTPAQSPTSTVASIVYPGERWLLENRESLRRYASDYDWKLPGWTERTGELQLRVKLKHGYAVLARVPWNPAHDRSR